jgi:aspartate/methionine/tyrosine aminotransferase
LERVDARDVQIVTGAAEALLILFFLAAEPDANVVLPMPGFPANGGLADALKLESRHYQLRPGDGYRIDVDEIKGLVDRNTQFVLVNSPHNPTGAVLSDRELESLHDFCAYRGIQLVCDQVYHPIYHGTPMRSAARLPHSTVLGDLSKALCLSGLRVGWIVERDARRRELYLNARSYFTVTNNVIGERLATFAIRHREEIYAKAARVASANLSLLDKMFSEHADILQWVRPEGGMTTFPWLTGHGDSREFCGALAERGILIVPGDCFGMSWHLRIGFAATGDEFPRALALFTEFLDTQGKRWKIG